MLTLSSTEGLSRRCVLLVAVLTTGIAGLPHVASLTAQEAARSTGRIAGRITAAESGDALSGALVAVVGTGLRTTTDENGNYLLSRAPSGDVRVRVTYLGRKPEVRTLNVGGESPTRLDVALSPVALGPVVIEAVRAKGQAEALSRQHLAPNIMSIVAADQMGRFPDASAPEAVQRLPGVSIERDQGEGRYIKIRGGSAANTQVTINGEQVPSPEGEVRQIALDAVPVGVLEAVEVTKAITPDMDADAIGGAVNLVTKRAPENRVFSLETSGGYVPIRSDYSGLTSVTLGGRTPGRRLGALFSGSFSRRNFGSDGLEPDYELGDLRSDDALAELDVRRYTLMRARLGASGALDYRLGDGSSLFLTGLFSELTDHEQRRRVTHAIEDGEIAYAHKNRKEILSTLNVMAGGEHLSRRGMKLDYRVAFTRSQEDTPFDDEVSFLVEDVEFAPSLADPKHPQPNAGSALGGPYRLDAAMPASSLTRNRDYSGAVNLSIPLQFGRGAVGTLRVGTKYRDKRKDQRVRELEYSLADEAEDIVLGADLGRPFSNRGFNPGEYPIPFSTSPADIHNFLARFGSRLDEGELNLEAATNNYLLRERIAAAYGMTELHVTPRLLLVAGLRFERTSLATDGFAFDGETETVTPSSAANRYGNFFPMLHATYSVDEQTNVRAAITTTIFRPNFFDLVPYRVRDDDDLSIGNPSLAATTSRNVDLLIERYDQNIGLLSAGVFVKELRRPIFITTVENELGGETSQPVNASRGRILGVEVALQKRLTFLPGAWSGLGLYGNYTWTDSKATQPSGRETRLGGQADHVANAALSYERGRFSGQVSLNYTGGSILELGQVAEDDLLIDARQQIDLSTSVFVTSSTQLYLEALNLTNRPYRTYVLETIRPRQIEYYEPSLQLGVRWRP